jgi:hypothetical protein
MGEAVLKKESAGVIAVPRAERSSSKFLCEVFTMTPVRGEAATAGLGLVLESSVFPENAIAWVLTFRRLVRCCACAVAGGAFQEERRQVQLKAFTEDDGALYTLPRASRTGRLRLHGARLLLSFLSFSPRHH